MAQLSVRLVVRQALSGDEVCSLFIDKAEQAKLVADALVSTALYSHCYIVGFDYSGRVLFEVFPLRVEASEAEVPEPPQTSRFGLAKVIPLRPRKR